MEKTAKSKIKVLVCPLNWGLGHATRMVPVVNAFLEQGCDVVVAASGGALQYMKDEFGNRTDYLLYLGKEIRYSRGSGFFARLTLQMPSLLYFIWAEYRWMQQTGKKLQPDIIISDNRYGARSPHILSVFVTHQLFIRMPRGMGWMEGIVRAINHRFIRAFHHCWVPDLEGEGSLSGALSQKKILEEVRFVGILSRFSGHTKYPQPELDLPESFILVILSGPEPQRSILENALEKQLTGKSVVFFRGITGESVFVKKGLHYWFNHGDNALMGFALQNCELVICRSGYSSLMDLSVFGKKAVLLPTPGQTEQEYLAHMLAQKDCVAVLQQHEVQNLNSAMEKALGLKGLSCIEDKDLVNEAVKYLIEKVR